MRYPGVLLRSGGICHPRLPPLFSLSLGFYLVEAVEFALIYAATLLGGLVPSVLAGQVEVPEGPGSALQRADGVYLTALAFF